MAIILYKNHSEIKNITEEVALRLKNNQTDNFIYIVPTRRKVRELSRELLKYIPTQTAPALNIFTLETFTITLHDIFCNPKKFLNITTQAVLFNEAIKSKTHDLTYFFPKGTHRLIPKGTLEKIINIINYLKEKGIYPSILHSEISSAEDHEKQKIADILTIYETYDDLLKGKFQDVGTIYKELNETLERNLIQGNAVKANELFRKLFPNSDSIFVAGFDEFSDPEITMLQYVSNFSKIGFVISFDYYTGNDELFGHLKKNYEKFRSLGFKSKTDINLSTKDFKNHIVKNLFNNTTTETPDFQDKITIIKAKNREVEVELIAKLIKKLISEKPNQDLSKICIAVYQPQIYTKLFHEIFPRYGIPANITDRFPLDQSPLIVAIISLLNIKQNNFRQRDIIRAFSSPYFSFDDSNIDIGNLYSVSTSLKINTGVEFWKNRITRRTNQINEELKTVEDDHQNDILINEKEVLNKANEDIGRIHKLFSIFDGLMTPIQFRDRLISVIENLNIQKNIINFKSENHEFIEKDTRAYQKFLNLLDEIVGLLILQEKEFSAESLKFYIEQLKTGISQTRYNIRQKYGYGVYVTAMEETRGLDFDVMFIAGLVDGEFPPVYQPEIFLSSKRQKEIEQYHLTENRYLFYQCLTNFSDNLYLTYPSKDEESELVRSSFINSLLKIISCSLHINDIPEYLAKPVYCTDEYISRIGHNEAIGIKNHIPENIDNSIKNTIDDIRYAIKIENQRLTTNDEYKGFIFNGLDETSRDKLEQYKEKIYSVSQLEKYAACPFQYFTDNVLYLKSIPEPEDGITSLEKGSILHEVLFQFYVDRREKGLPYLHQCNENEYKIAVDELTKLTKEKLDSLNVNDALVFLEKELILGTPHRTGILEEFLESEKSRNLEVSPAYFEVPFGPRVGNRQNTDPILNQENPVVLGEVKVRGKVDRVEIGPNNFTIVDYKTGISYPTMEEIEKGLKFQIPIYMGAIEKILTEKLNINVEPAAGTHYNLTAKLSERIIVGNRELQGKAFIQNKQTSGFVSNNVELREIINKAIGYVNQYVGAISRGEFPITSEEKMEKVCKNCTFQKMCRKQQL